MERLTFFNGDYIPCVNEDSCMEEQGGFYCGAAIDRLAAYEDTGLTPEEVSLLAKAGEDGSMAVAANANGTSSGKISAVCKGKRTKVSGHRFRKLTREETEAALRRAENGDC